VETNTLFTPLELGAVNLRNRIVMAPTTRMRAKMPANIPWQPNATLALTRGKKSKLAITPTKKRKNKNEY
jgi:N-ethylmaleimide reductase